MVRSRIRKTWIIISPGVFLFVVSSERSTSNPCHLYSHSCFIPSCLEWSWSSDAPQTNRKRKGWDDPLKDSCKKRKCCDLYSLHSVALWITHQPLPTFLTSLITCSCVEDTWEAYREDITVRMAQVSWTTAMLEVVEGGSQPQEQPETQVYHTDSWPPNLRDSICFVFSLSFRCICV